MGHSMKEPMPQLVSKLLACASTGSDKAVKRLLLQQARQTSAILWVSLACASPRMRGWVL